MRMPRRRWVAVLCTREPYAPAEPRQQFGPYWTPVGAERVADWANRDLIPWELASQQRYRIWSLDDEHAMRGERTTAGRKAAVDWRDVTVLILLLATCAASGAAAFIDSFLVRIVFETFAVAALPIWAVWYVKSRKRSE